MQYMQGKKGSVIFYTTNKLRSKDIISTSEFFDADRRVQKIFARVLDFYK